MYGERNTSSADPHDRDVRILLNTAPNYTYTKARSGNAMTQQVTDALSAGISSYLVKPCKQADLARTLIYWEHIVDSSADHRPLTDRLREVP